MRQIVVWGILLPLVVTMSIMPTNPSLTSSNATAWSVQQFQLTNGLRVWVQARPDATSATAVLMLRVGARDETPTNNGISHFVEHMVFDGTERWDENQIKDVITHRGGSWNGWTSLDRTAYFAQVADRDVDTALEWLSQIVVHPTFPANKVDKEREVIFQEKSGRYGWLVNTLDALGFGYELDRDVRRAIFPQSTLGFRVVGEDASLDHTDRAALQAYYQTHYLPNNAVLVIVGNVTLDQVRQQVEAYFGAWLSGTLPPQPDTPGRPSNGPQQVTIRGPLVTDQDYLQVGTRTVGRTDPDRWALEVLADLLEEDLTKEIRYQQGLVYSLSALNTWFDDAGYFEIATMAESGHRAEISAAIDAHLAQIQAGQISAERLAQSKTGITGRWALSMEDNVSRAVWLADWALVLDATASLPDYVAQINAVTPADLQRVVTTYFTPEQRYVGLHEPIVTVSGSARLIGVAAGLGATLWAGRKLWKRSRRQPAV